MFSTLFYVVFFQCLLDYFIFYLQLIKGCDFIGNIGSFHKLQCIDLFVTCQPCSGISTKACFSSHVSLTLVLSTTSHQDFFKNSSRFFMFSFIAFVMDALVI